MMGVDRKTVFRNRHVLENMLGFIQVGCITIS